MKKIGLLLMFLGIVLLAIFLLSDFGNEMSLTVWLVGFLFAMVVSIVGIVLLIIDLFKAIKEEKLAKQKTE